MAPNLKNKKINTLVISDIHLGLPASRVESVLKLLSQYDFKRLILNGDIFDDLNFNRLKSKEWQFLSKVRELSDSKSGVEVIWLIGNHDEVLYELMSHLVGVPVFSEFKWVVNGKKFLAMHGHQFDKLIQRSRLVTKAGSKIFYGFQKMEGPQHKISGYLKHMIKKFRRSSKLVAKKALAYGKLKETDYIFCGHTHQPLEASSDNVTYMNSGSWAGGSSSSHSSYIIVDEQGQPLLVLDDN